MTKPTAEQKAEALVNYAIDQLIECGVKGTTWTAAYVIALALIEWYDSGVIPETEKIWNTGDEYVNSPKTDVRMAILNHLTNGKESQV